MQTQSRRLDIRYKLYLACCISFCLEHSKKRPVVRKCLKHDSCEWKEIRASNIGTKFWNWSNILLLVRSLRQSNLLLFIASLQHLAPIILTLHHIHYSRWMSVFIQDILLLPEKNHKLFTEFLRGSFVVKSWLIQWHGVRPGS